MKYYLYLLLAVCLGHSAQAQLLNKLKERASQAVQSAGSSVPSLGTKARQAAEGKVADKATGAVEQATEKESIIFSKEPFKEGQTTSTATDFLPTDNIYARVLMPRTLYDALAEHGKEDQPHVVMTVGLTADVQENFQLVRRYTYCTIAIPQADFKKKYYDLDVLPALSRITTHYEGQGGTKDHIATLLTYFGNEASLPSIPFGKQRIRLEFGDGQDLVVGYFNFTVAGWKEKKPLEARVQAIRNGVSAAVAKNNKLPEVFRTGGGKFNDPQLSTAALKQKLGAGTIRFAVEPGSVDYTIHKNALGVPEYKITRPIWTVEKGEDGNCYYTRYYLRREYEGGGKYGPLDFAATTADKVPVACENVK